jgi:7-cyano-7-deazaguanine synthase in queuosine biosynthesis
MRHLVMLSGGPDSALALVQALASGEPVVALHVLIVTHARRHEYERAACRRIVARLRRDWPELDFHEASLTPPSRAAYADLPILGAFAAMLANGYGDIGKTWVGMDLQQDDGAVDAAFCTVMRTAIFPKRFPSTWIPTEHSPAPGTNLSKQQIREALGEELWALTWSCRNPGLTGITCGRCESCIERSGTHAP